MRSAYRELVLAVTIAMVSVAAWSQQASNYPARPVRVVIAQGPGSSIDTMCRVVLNTGIPGFDLVGWAGLAAPRGLPKGIGDKLHATLRNAINSPGDQCGVEAPGAEPLVGTPQEFAALIKRDWTSYGDAIRAAALKPN